MVTVSQKVEYASAGRTIPDLNYCQHIANSHSCNAVFLLFFSQKRGDFADFRSGGFIPPRGGISPSRAAGGADLPASSDLQEPARGRVAQIGSGRARYSVRAVLSHIGWFLTVQRRARSDAPYLWRSLFSFGQCARREAHCKFRDCIRAECECLATAAATHCCTPTR